MNDLYFTYGKFEEAIDEILFQIDQDGFEPDIILAPLRGGAVPATFLSHRLSNDRTDDVRIFAFEAERGGRLTRHTVDHITEMLDSGKRLLWIDDIVDSGGSLKDFFYFLPHAKDVVKTASLIWNEDCGVEPDFYAHKINRKTFPDYIVFFWEE